MADIIASFGVRCDVCIRFGSRYGAPEGAFDHSCVLDSMLRRATVSSSTTSCHRRR